MSPRVRKAALFVAMTLFASWLYLDVFFILGVEWNTPAAIAVAVGYMFVPLACAIVVQKVIFKGSLPEELGLSFRPNRWWLVAWLLPAGAALLTFGVSLLFTGASFSPDFAGFYERIESVFSPEQIEEMKRQAEALPVNPFWLGLAQGLIAGPTVNAIAAFGEEAGWRGLLQKELGHIGFWKSSLIIGAIWGVWHAPIILQGHNYPQHPTAGVFMMIAWCMLLAPLLGYVRIRSRSVLAAAIMHGSLNGTAGLAIVALKGGSDLAVGVTGLAGFIVLALLNAGLFFYDRFLAAVPVSECRLR